MQKCNPEEVRELSEDLQGVLHRHPDAVRANPDIADDIVHARDKAAAKYRQITEKTGHPMEVPNA